MGDFYDDSQQDNDDIGPGGIFMQLPAQAKTHDYLRSRMAPVTQEKSWGSKLVYESGTSYIIGAIGGGIIGAGQGWRQGAKMNMKLRMNSVLNSSGRLCSVGGRNFGVFGLMYSGSRSLAKNRRAKDDVWNDIIGVTSAATLTTLPRGPVTALGVGAALGSVASIMLFTKMKLEERIERS